MLAAGLGLGAYLVLKRRSRTGVAGPQRRRHRLLRLLPPGLHVPDRRHPERHAVAGRSAVPDLVRRPRLLLPAARRGVPVRARVLRRRVPARRGPGPGAAAGRRRCRRRSTGRSGGCRTSTSPLAVLFAGWGMPIVGGERASPVGPPVPDLRVGPVHRPLPRLRRRSTCWPSAPGSSSLGMFYGRPYCRWLCPYGALLSLCVAGLVEERAHHPRQGARLRAVRGRLPVRRHPRLPGRPGVVRGVRALLRELPAAT